MDFLDYPENDTYSCLFQVNEVMACWSELAPFWLQFEFHEGKCTKVEPFTLYSLLFIISFDIIFLRFKNALRHESVKKSNVLLFSFYIYLHITRKYIIADILTTPRPLMQSKLAPCTNGKRGHCSSYCTVCLYAFYSNA